MEFNEEYWASQAGALEIVDRSVKHVNYAMFVADHFATKLRYVEELGWYRWNGIHWEATSDNGSALQAITDAAALLAGRINEHPADLPWASTAMNVMLNGRERRYIVSEMEALREFRGSVDDFDANRHLLTFKNLTVDLRTGEMLDHNPDHMLTHCAKVDYDPTAECPRFDRFTTEIFPGNEELQRYYQTFLGMCITGEVRDHVLGVWYGEHGRNGKGATIRTMMKAFGRSIVLEVPFTTFERSNFELHTEDVAQLRTVRMVVAQEGNPEAPMNTARLKSWTGGDSINARHLRKGKFSFDPKFTLVLATNHLPEFSTGGAALWARTRAILFGEHFVGDRVDKTLEPTIQGPELEGFARWVVEGAIRYYKEGLVDPECVTAATEMHKQEVDPLKNLISEVFEYDEGSSVLRSKFNADLKEWREANGDRSAKFSPSSVQRHLLHNGVELRQVKGKGVTYFGIRLASDEPSAEAKKRAADIAAGKLAEPLFLPERSA